MYRTAGVGLLTGASLYLLSLLSYDPLDPSWLFVDTSRSEVHNLLGKWGATVAGFSFQYLGKGTFLVCAGFLLLGTLFLVRQTFHFLDRPAVPAKSAPTGLENAGACASMYAEEHLPEAEIEEVESLPHVDPLLPSSAVTEFLAPDIDSIGSKTEKLSDAAPSFMEHLYLDRPSRETEKRWIEKEELLYNSERWLQSRKKR